jgi:cytosolic carboxypeptidase protein 5
MNLNCMRVFASTMYKPVWRSPPSQPDWQRVQGETIYTPSFASFYKYTWVFEPQTENDYYFSYAPPYPYSDITKSIANFEKFCPSDTYFYREMMILSLDRREIELVTISSKSNFLDTRENHVPGIFNSTPRCLASKKPIVFITARVHPGETPSSFLLDAIMRVILSSDPRGVALRHAYVFKIIPVLNPDGVYRGNFRVDQNGVNLNRCYIDPSRDLHPTIYAAKTYFDYIQHLAKFYFDLHAHASKRGCFLFGNSLQFEKQVENQLLAKLIELNTGYFEYAECDFSEKSMTSKDPKDHNSKEGSGRVALHKLSGIVHSYTIECSYFILRPLHPLHPAIAIKTGKRYPDTNFNENFIIGVYNRCFFNDFGSGLMFSLLDLEGINPISRLPLSIFRYVEAVREWVKAKILAYNRMINKKNSSKLVIFKPEQKDEKFSLLPKIPARKVHKMNVITPVFNESALNSNNSRILFSLGRIESRGIENGSRFKSAM